MSVSPSAGRSPKRVLVYCLGSLGDTVVAFPSLRLIARAFPQAERKMLTSFPPSAKAPPSSAVVGDTGLIHGYYRYTYGTRSVRELLTLWWQLFRWRPEVLVYLSGPRGIRSARRDALFFRLCGIRRQVGVPLTDDMQGYRVEPSGGVMASETGGTILERESSRLVRNIAELGSVDLDHAASWDLELTSGERARASEVLSQLGELRVVVVSIGTKNPSNDWEPGNWRSLLRQVAELYPDCALAICGAPGESEVSESLAEAWRERSPNPALNLRGALLPRETAALMERAAVFIGHDSGPGHLAAAVQTRCVSIYGSRNLPGIWFPYGKGHRVLYHRVQCAGCQLVTCAVEGKRCILSITVEEVLTQIAAVLGDSAILGSPESAHIRVIEDAGLS